LTCPQGFAQQRTATLNRIRGLLSELGIVLPLKAATVRREALQHLEDLPGWANTVIGQNSARDARRGAGSMPHSKRAQSAVAFSAFLGLPTLPRTMSFFADPPSLLPLAQRERLARGRRLATPGGQGDLVWHVWGERRAGEPPVVVLHGGSGSWTHWVRNIADLVDAGRELWIPDLPGFGDSASPASGGDADALAGPMAEGLRALFGPRQCDLVGFSLGGLTAGLLLAAMLLGEAVNVAMLVVTTGVVLCVFGARRFAVRPQPASPRPT